ncbi:MAG: hypothetical protein ABEJ42_06155 [Halobacteriaceae archaeon]
MRLSRRALCGAVGTAAAAALAGCADAPEPLPPEAQTLKDAVEAAYAAEGAAVAESVGFSAQDLGGDLGWHVVADFRLVDGGASLETMLDRFDRTALLVFQHLYATDVQVTDPTARGFVMWDDPRDFSPEPRQVEFASAYLQGETAAGLDLAALDPSRLSEVADSYIVQERYVRDQTTTPTDAAPRSTSGDA